jgi:hypothetical protein
MRLTPASDHRLWGWLGLIPLLVGASFALLRYAAWSAVVSAYYGLPSEAWRVKEAGAKAHLYGWALVGLVAGATIVATVLIPPLKSESVPPGLKGTLRFLLAVLFVAGSVTLVAYGLSTAGQYWK